MALVGSLLTLFIAPPLGFMVLFVGAGFAFVNLYQKARPRMRRKYRDFKWWYLKNFGEWEVGQT